MLDLKYTTEQQMLFIENLNVMKLVQYSRYTKIPCIKFFQASEEGKSDNDNDFKTS